MTGGDRAALRDAVVPAGLDDRLVVHLAVEPGDGPVRARHAGFDVAQVPVLRHVGDLDVTVLLPLVGEDLDADVLGLLEVDVVFPLHPVEDDGRGARRHRRGLHGQLFGRGVAEVVDVARRRASCDEQRGEREEEESSHHRYFALKTALERSSARMAEKALFSSGSPLTGTSNSLTRYWRL